MKVHFILIILIVCLINNQAKCDHIVVNGQTMAMNAVSPFESYPGIIKLRETLKNYRTQCMDDGCSFSSEWKVVNKELVLTSIHSCECNTNHRAANLNNIFKNQLHDGVLKASWFTGKLWLIANTDKPVAYIGISPLLHPLYPRELCLNINKGMITSIENHIYPKPVESAYYKNADSLNKFIYTHINWNKIDLLQQKSETVFFNFQPDSAGHPIDIKYDDSYPIKRTLDQSRIEEANRILGLLTWPTYYYHGEIVKNYSGIGIEFSKQMRDRYADKN